MAADERREGAGVPAACALDQLGLFQWPAHHRPFYTRWENPVPREPDSRTPAGGCGPLGRIRFPMLPPGPPTPAAVQTLEWIARPTDLLRRSAARYGEPFTLRTLWADAPMVLVSDPAEIRRIHAEPPAVLRGGASSQVLEPFAGPSSILLTDGEEHLRARRLVLPPFHGERMEARRDEIARLAAAEVERWPAGEPLRTLPRMQALTLDVILRVVLGAPDARLREAIRAALDLAQSLARLIVLSLVPPGTPPWRRFDRAVARVDALLLRGAPEPAARRRGRDRRADRGRRHASASCATRS